MTNQSPIAPERMRTRVKDAGSMLPCRRARRQRMELLAKAIIASAVRLRVRAVVTWHKQSVVKRIHLVAHTRRTSSSFILWTAWSEAIYAVRTVVTLAQAEE